MELTWIVKNRALNSDKKVMEVSLVFINSVPVLSAGMKQPVGGVLGSIFAGYVSLASQNPYPIKVYSVANYRPHLSHFWANRFFNVPNMVTFCLSISLVNPMVEMRSHPAEHLHKPITGKCLLPSSKLKRSYQARLLV